MAVHVYMVHEEGNMCVDDPFYGNLVLYAAQFWNIPVTVLREGDEVFLQLFNDTLDPRYRLIPAEPAPRTWDHTHATCYYVGNAQGGPVHSHDAVESVIEGNVLQYETSSLFSPEFDFSQFDDSFCITPT